MSLKRLLLLLYCTLVSLIHISIQYFLFNVAEHILSLDYVTDSETRANYVMEWLGKSAGRKLCTKWSRSKTAQKIKLNIALKYREYGDKFYNQQIIWKTKFVISYEVRFIHEITAVWLLLRSSLSDRKPSLPDWWYNECTASEFRETFYIICEMFQAHSVKDAAFQCAWVGTPIPFQRCLMFIIAAANKEFQLTAGKFVPVSNATMMSVCI
jgi:hypothetical protein